MMRLLRQLRLQLAPQRDAFEQGSRFVDARQAIAERRIHVEMGVDEGRRDQVAGRVDFACALRRQACFDGDDAIRAHADIDVAAAIGQAGIAYDEIHGRSCSERQL